MGITWLEHVVLLKISYIGLQLTIIVIIKESRDSFIN